MPIYFVRHGKSAANVKGVFAGQKDNSPLVEEGILQAEATAQQLAKLPIKKVISSPLLRARQTTDVIKRFIDDNIPILIDERINEYDMGSLTGKPIHAVTSDELALLIDAEKPEDLRERVLSFLSEYNNSDEVILMVSHAAVGRMIEAMKKNIPLTEFYSIKPYPNAQATKLDLGWLSEYELSK